MRMRLVAAAAAAAVLSAPAAAAPPTVPVPGKPAFPAPPRNAVVFSRQMGPDGLALGVVPYGEAVVVQASVLGRQGNGVNGLAIRFGASGVSARGAPCGAGRYCATLITHARPAAITVAVRNGPAPTRWRVPFPARTPDASRLLARASRVWRALSSVSFHESFGSGTGHVVSSTWRIQAPDRVAYRVKGGWDGIIIGTKRWDRSPGDTKWTASAQTRLTQPVPGWGRVTNAHLLGGTTAHGRAAWRVSFFDPDTPSWFELTLDKKTLRTLDVWMVATAHFMHDAYRAFNATAAILPPASS